MAKKKAAAAKQAPKSSPKATKPAARSAPKAIKAVKPVAKSKASSPAKPVKKAVAAKSVKALKVAKPVKKTAPTKAIKASKVMAKSAPATAKKPTIKSAVAKKVASGSRLAGAISRAVATPAANRLAPKAQVHSEPVVHPGAFTPRKNPKPAPAKNPNRPKVRSDEQAERGRALSIEAARLLNDNRCEEIIVMDVRGISKNHDFVVIGSGTSDRQMRSCGQEIAQLARAMGHDSSRTNVDDRTTWLVLDCMDVVVHVFEPNARAHYDLESMWGDAPRIHWQRAAGELPPNRAKPGAQKAALEAQTQASIANASESPFG